MKGWVDLGGWLHTEIKCRLPSRSFCIIEHRWLILRLAILVKLRLVTDRVTGQTDRHTATAHTAHIPIVELYNLHVYRFWALKRAFQFNFKLTCLGSPGTLTGQIRGPRNDVPVRSRLLFNGWWQTNRRLSTGSNPEFAGGLCSLVDVL